MDIFSSLFAYGANEIIRIIIRGLTKKISNTKDADRASILRELRRNLKVLSHRFRMGISREALINELSNEAIGEAEKEDYNFKKLRGRRPHKLTEEMFPNGTNKYLGWTAKEMVLSIDSKIDDLKLHYKLYNEKDREFYRKNIIARLNNLNYQILSLAAFITYK
jgi:hypothetical protein